MALLGIQWSLFWLFCGQKVQSGLIRFPFCFLLLDCVCGWLSAATVWNTRRNAAGDFLLVPHRYVSSLRYMWSGGPIGWSLGGGSDGAEPQARNLQLAKPLELTASCKQVCRTSKENTVKLKRCPETPPSEKTILWEAVVTWMAMVWSWHPMLRFVRWSATRMLTKITPPA